MSEVRSNSANRGGRRETSPRPVSSRVPPHNLNAEESLLGAMLLSRDAVNAVAEAGVRVEHFYKPAHQHVFDAIRGLLTGGGPVDPVTVADELRRVGLSKRSAASTSCSNCRTRHL